MKRCLILLTVMLLSMVQLQAAEYKGGKTVHIAATDTTHQDLMAAAGNVQLEGPMLGDIFAAGENVIISGDIGDDLIATAKNVSLTGDIGGMVFTGGETVLIEGDIGDDVFIGAGTVRITEKAHIRGNVFVGTGKLLFEGGIIEGNLKGGSGEAFLNGQVNGDIEYGTKNIEFGQNFDVAGAIELKLPHWMQGKDIENLPSKAVIKFSERDYLGSAFSFIYGLVAAILFGICYVRFFENFATDQLAFAKDKMLPSLGFGFLTLVATPVAMVILFAMLISIPIALVVLAAYLLVLYLGGIISGLFLGAEILSRTNKDDRPPALIGALALGVFVLALLKYIPFIGFIFSLLAAVFGMGSLVYFIIEKHKNQESEAAA